MKRWQGGQRFGEEGGRLRRGQEVQAQGWRQRAQKRRRPRVAASAVGKKAQNQGIFWQNQLHSPRKSLFY